MLISKRKSVRRRVKISPIKKVKKFTKEVYFFNFPIVKGYEDLTKKLNGELADSPFIALFNVFELTPVKTEKMALEGQTVLEYLGRAFENGFPEGINNYAHLLEMLLKEYDDQYYIPGRAHISPHEFLKALLEDSGLNQKDLVPEIFPSASQVSEFLHQRQGRSKLNYEQAIALSKKFKVSPKNFLDIAEGLE